MVVNSGLSLNLAIDSAFKTERFLIKVSEYGFSETR